MPDCTRNQALNTDERIFSPMSKTKLQQKKTRPPAAQPPQPEPSADTKGHLGALVDPAGCYVESISEEEHTALRSCLNLLRDLESSLAGGSSPARLIERFLKDAKASSSEELLGN